MDEDLQEQIAASNMSVDEVLTLASIIQREAANNDDMAMVSSVLHNRLKNGASQDIYTLDCDSPRCTILIAQSTMFRKTNVKRS